MYIQILIILCLLLCSCKPVVVRDYPKWYEEIDYSKGKGEGEEIKGECEDLIRDMKIYHK